MYSASQCATYNSLQSNYKPPWSRDRTLSTSVSIPKNNGNNHGISKKQSFALAVKRSSQGVLKTRSSCVKPNSISFASPLEVEVGASASNPVKLSVVFPNATSYYPEYSSTSPDATPGDIENLSTDNDTVSFTLSSQAAVGIMYTITVMSFYGANIGAIKSFSVKSVPAPEPTASDIPIGTINAPPESFGESEKTLSEYFNNATNGYQIDLSVSMNTYSLTPTFQDDKIYIINNELSNTSEIFNATIMPRDANENGIESQSKPFKITATG